MAFLRGLYASVRQWFDYGGLVGQLRAMNLAIKSGQPLTEQEIQMLRVYTEVSKLTEVSELTEVSKR